MKIGIIGLGNVAQLHVSALKELSPDAYAGGWSRTTATAERFCAKNGGQAYSSIDELLRDEKIDAVIICTDASTHFKYAQMALSADKHVLLEKPICDTAEQIKTLSELATTKNKVCMPSHNYVYAETMQRVKSHLSKGNLGKVVNFWALYNKKHPAEMGSPNLTMRELMIHHIYSMLYFIGRPKSVYATASNVHFNDPAAHDQIMIIAEYTDGTIATLWGSFSADDRSRDPWSVYFKIIGTEGSAVVPWDITKFGEARLPFWDDGTYWDSFYQIQNYFINECLARQRNPLSTLGDAHDAALIMEAANRSILEKRAVDIHYQ